MSKINLYDVLGVPRDCDQSLIDTVYKSLVRVFHPDVFKGDKAFAQEKLKIINEAYSVVGDVDRRKTYDADLKRSESSGATEEIYEDDSSENQPYDDMYTDEWKVVIGYFPEIDEMYRSLRRLNLSLSAAFKILLVSEKNYRDARSFFTKLQQEFLRAKFGKNPDVQLLALHAIEKGHRKFALDLNKDLTILGEDEHPIILEKLAARYKEFADEYYQKCGIPDIKYYRKSFGLKPGRYSTAQNKIFYVKPDFSACILSNRWDLKYFDSVEDLVKSGLLSAEDIRTAEKMS